MLQFSDSKILSDYLNNLCKSNKYSELKFLLVILKQHMNSEISTKILCLSQTVNCIF